MYVMTIPLWVRRCTLALMEREDVLNEYECA